MSTSIHASIEYRIHGSTTMSFAEVSPGTSYSTIFERLGNERNPKAVVPLRGWPMDGEYIDDMGWVAQKQLTCLVVRSQTEARDNEGDGVCISPTEAQRYLSLPGGYSKVLPERYNDPETSEYWRISDPDIHDVNWITANELEVALAKVREDGGGYLAGYDATLAAMRALEADDRLSHVRLVYGFDN